MRYFLLSRLAVLNRRRASGTLSRAFRRQDGQAIIETAVVLPAFILLMFGIFQFAMVMISYLSAAYAIRTATRYAAVHSTSSLNPISSTQVQSLVKSSLFMPGVGTTPTVTVTYIQDFGASAGNIPGNEISVQISYSQTIKAPYYTKTLSMSSIDYRVIMN